MVYGVRRGREVPDGGLEGPEIEVDFGAEPLVFDFAPQGFDFVEMGAMGRQVENVRVLVFPRRESRLESGRVMDFGIVKHQHGGARASGGPGVFVSSTRKGLLQSALKCRGREYLRIIYGPDYLLPGNIERLVSPPQVSQSKTEVRQLVNTQWKLRS